MKSEARRDLIEVVGVVAIVVSLIFVGVQVRLDREIAVAEGNLANAANKIEENNAFLEHSDVWVRGNSGESLDEDEVVIFRYLVKSAYDVARMEITRLSRLGNDDLALMVAADFAGFLSRNEGARSVWVQLHQESLEDRRVILGHEGARALDQTIIDNLAKLDRAQE